MARLSKNDTAILLVGVIIGVPVVVIGKLWQLAQENRLAAIAVAVLMLMGTYFLVSRRRERRDAAAAAAMTICQRLTQEHIETLTKKRQNTVSVGDYGEVLEREFDQEIAYFVNTVVHPHIRDQLELLGDPNLIGPSQQVIVDFIKAEVAKATPPAR